MRVTFRCDASARIGTGHVARCLTLADRLRDAAAATAFLCGDRPGHMAETIRRRGHDVELLEVGEGDTSDYDWRSDRDQTRQALEAGTSPTDWLVVDHYRLDSRWELGQRGRADRIMVIDDLADRSHECDLLLDQNLHAAGEQRYEGLVPATCRQLIGPRFALLRPEFTRLPTVIERRVRSVLVFFGGGDSSRAMRLALDAIGGSPHGDIRFEIVIGSAYPSAAELRARCESMDNVRLQQAVGNMADLMGRVDLAICSSGSVVWELGRLGVPALLVVVADNQVPIAEALDEHGVARSLGDVNALSAERLAQALSGLTANHEERQAMSRRWHDIGVGTLGADHVVELMLGREAK